MESLEVLRRRMDSTEDLQSLVRSMKALSAANIHHYEEAEAGLQDLRGTIDLGLQALFREYPVRMRPAASRAGSKILVAFGSERGLCGGFNETVAELSSRHVSRHRRNKGPMFVLAIGERVADHMRSVHLVPDAVLPFPATMHGLGGVCERIVIWIDRLQKLEPVEHVETIFNVRDDNGEIKPSAHVLLPVPMEHLRSLQARRWPSRGLPVFTVHPQQLFSWLIRQHLFANLYHAGLSSMMSENAARLAAMHRAERNIEETLAALTARYRQSRQDTITGELMDIVSGYEVLDRQGSKRKI